MLIGIIVDKLIDRGENHDASKLAVPEVEAFNTHTHRLAALSYGTAEYMAVLAKLKPALDHHYAVNRHHPEFHPDGIRGMNLVDIIEMLCDWKASTLRHKNGAIRKSLELNQKRFGYSDELKQIFWNTLPLLEE